MESNSSDDDNFEGFVVSPEEKSSYKVWKRKRRTSQAMWDNSDDDMSGDDDNDDESDSTEDDNDNDNDIDDDDDDDDDEDDDESAIEEDEEHKDAEIEDLDDPTDDINIQDSSDEMGSSSTDQCPVCLMSLKGQLLGTPNNCPHVFCFECIQEWAKNATTCPVGRKAFNEILVHATKKGPVLQRIPVEERQAEDEEEEEDPTYCEVCGECNREDRMLLCDRCDNGYHMECLTPPAEFVPLEEWFCPMCASHEDVQEGEEQKEEELTAAPRTRTTRGRPRGSTAKRVSISARTATTRTARTVASTRGRGRTGRGRGRGRGSSRGRGRGGRGLSTRGQSSSTKTKKKGKKKMKKSAKSAKKTGSSGTKKRRKTKKKMSKTSKKRRTAEEDEVSPYIYEPPRRGKTVHARLLESLNSAGPSTEPGRTTSIGRMPFPNRVEPSSSFSLFGNAYALYDFDDEEDGVQATSRREEQVTPCSLEATNPDVLESIFQDLDTLHSSSTQLSRDGKIVVTTDESRSQGSTSGNVRSTCKDNDNIETDVEIRERTSVEKRSLSGAVPEKPDNSEVPSKDKLTTGEKSSRGNICESLLSSKAGCTASSGKTVEIRQTSSTSFKSSSKPPAKPPSFTSMLSGFRIPKRSPSCDAQNERNQMTCSTRSVDAAEEKSPNSSTSKFKIPKLTRSASCDGSLKLKPSSAVSKTADVQQRLAASSKTSVKQKVASSSKGVSHYSCFTESKTRERSPLFSNSMGPVTQKNLHQKNSLNSSSSALEFSVTTSTNVTKCHVLKTSSIPHSYTVLPSAASSKATAVAVRPCVTNSSNVARSHKTNMTASSHAITPNTSTLTSAARLGGMSSNDATTGHTKKLHDIPHDHGATSSSVTPSTKVAPLIDNLKPVGGKEQRRSNIEIIKMLQEKQRSMRKQMSDDPKAPVQSSDLPSRSSEKDSKMLPREGLINSDKSPSSSRGVNLPVAVVKPHITSSVVTMTAALPSSSLESSPVKSIASGIVDAHSCNTQEFKRVRSESTAHIPKEESVIQRQDGKVAGANSDRDQQRKLGIARLQRHQQIVDEVKLSLKPFFKRGVITKDDYKLIMRKSVEKIKESNSSVDRDRVGRLVKKYIHKIKGSL